MALVPLAPVVEPLAPGFPSCWDGRSICELVRHLVGNDFGYVVVMTHTPA